MTDEQKNDYLEIIKSAIQVRGFIIHNLTYLERCIDEAIAAHFCKDHKLREQMLELVISANGMNFKSKREILKSIIEKNYSDIDDKYPTLFTHVKEISEERNIFAHRLLNTSAEGMKKFKDTGELSFVAISKVNKYYTKQDLDLIVQKSNNCIIAFRQILGLKNPDDPTLS